MSELAPASPSAGTGAGLPAMLGPSDTDTMGEYPGIPPMPPIGIPG